MVAKRLTADVKAGGPTATDAIQALTDAQAAGKPMALADVGGPNIRGMAGHVARQPGESKNIATSFLAGRDAEAANRLSQDVAKYVHGDASMRQTTEALLAATIRRLYPFTPSPTSAHSSIRREVSPIQGERRRSPDYQR
jgi:hypothetical protein